MGLTEAIYKKEIADLKKEVEELRAWKHKTILESFQIADNFRKLDCEYQRTKKELTITQNLYYKDSKDLRDIINAYRTPNYN
jgi:hypothetical protein